MALPPPRHARGTKPTSIPMRRPTGSRLIDPRLVRDDLASSELVNDGVVVSNMRVVANGESLRWPPDEASRHAAARDTHKAFKHGSMAIHSFPRSMCAGMVC